MSLVIIDGTFVIDLNNVKMIQIDTYSSYMYVDGHSEGFSVSQTSAKKIQAWIHRNRQPIIDIDQAVTQQMMDEAFPAEAEQVEPMPEDDAAEVTATRTTLDDFVVVADQAPVWTNEVVIQPTPTTPFPEMAFTYTPGAFNTPRTGVGT